MQAQVTGWLGSNRFATAAIGIGLLAATLVGVTALAQDVELPGFGDDASTTQHYINVRDAGSDMQFMYDNLYHPGFETVIVNSALTPRDAVETRFWEDNAVINPGAEAPRERVPNEPY